MVTKNNKSGHSFGNKVLSGALVVTPAISQISTHLVRAYPPQNNNGMNDSIFSVSFSYLKYFFADLIYANIARAAVKLYRSFGKKEGQEPLVKNGRIFLKDNEDYIEHQNLHQKDTIFICDENRQKSYRLIDDNSNYSPHVSKALSYALLKDRFGDGVIFVQYINDRKGQIESIIAEGEALRKDIKETFNNISNSQNNGHTLLQKDNKDTFGVLKLRLLEVLNIKNPDLETENKLNHIVLCIDKLYYLQARFGELRYKLGEKDINEDEKIERQCSVYAAVYAEVIEELKGYAEPLGKDVWIFCVGLINDREVELFGAEKGKNNLYQKLFGICEYYRHVDDFRQNEVEDNENFKVIEVNNDILKENIEENQYVFLGNNGYEFGINNDDDNINDDDNNAAFYDLPTLEDIENGNQFNNDHYGSASAYQNLGGEVEVGYPDENEL